VRHPALPLASFLIAAGLLVACKPGAPLEAAPTRVCVFGPGGGHDADVRHRVHLAAGACDEKRAVPVYGSGYSRAQLEAAAEKARRVLACADAAADCPARVPDEIRDLIVPSRLRAVSHDPGGFNVRFPDPTRFIGDIFVAADGEVRVGHDDLGDEAPAPVQQPHADR